jgi:hypothetical protein
MIAGSFLAGPAFAGGFVSPEPQDTGYFGNAVCWTADQTAGGVRQAVVAAYWEDAGGQLSAGKVYLLNPITGAVLNTLVSGTPQAFGHYGAAIAPLGGVSGDGRAHLAVGAPDEDITLIRTGTVEDAGRVYVYGGLTGQELVSALVSPNIEAGGRFGYAIAHVFDVTGDNLADILVGAPGESIVGATTHCGRAYLFDGVSRQFVRALQPPDPETGAQFGAAVAGIPDVTGDGRSEVIIGAPQKDEGNWVNGGRVYVFNGATGALLHTLASPSPQPFGQFGLSVAGLSDVSSDGTGDFAVGAPIEMDVDLGGAGRVYVFEGVSGELLYPLSSPNPEESGWFGFSLAKVWDVNNDDRPDLVVGAPRESANDVANCGRTHIFDGAAGKLLYTLDAMKAGSLVYTLDSVNPIEEGQFGASVSDGMDVNGDQKPDLLVGAYREMVDDLDAAGRAYLFVSPDYVVPEVPGEGEGQAEGQPEGSVEGEGQPEGSVEGEGQTEGSTEGQPEGEGEPPDAGRMTVEITEIDDRAWVYLNDTIILAGAWGMGEDGIAIGHQPGYTGEVDITHLLRPGENRFRFVVWNAAACCSVSGFFRVRISGYSIYNDGVSATDSTEGIRFDDTVVWDWDGPGGQGGNNWAACEIACAGSLNNADADGDGLGACVENCLETRADLVDTDGDGMPDGWEARHGLNPLSSNAQGDPDADGLSNLDEYLGRSHPRILYSPAPTFHVAPPPTGQNSSNRGTRLSPWATIAYALSQTAPSKTAAARILLADGDYPENVTLEPGTTLAGMLGQAARIVGSITGAHGASLENLEVAQSAQPQPGASILLEMGDISMTVRNVVFRGLENHSALGIRTAGLAAMQATVIEGCTFTSLGTGIEVWGALPRIRRCWFEDIAVAGVAIRGSGPVSGSLGDVADPGSGYNTFRISGPGAVAVLNERAETVKMQNNDWGTTDPDEVAALISGSAVAGPFLAVGSAVLASSLFCTVMDAAAQAPILSAMVAVTPSVYSPVTQNLNGVYTFAAIPQGNYTVTATAGSSYQSRSQAVSVGSGQTVSVTLPLVTAEEEGEGEGQEEGEGEGQIEQFVLTLTVDGSGTVNPPVGTHTYASGAQVSVTATPENGWKLDRWQGAATGHANPVTVIMDSDKTLTAVFSRGGCGCGKSAPGLPGAGETFVAALTLLIMSAFGAQYRSRE